MKRRCHGVPIRSRETCEEEEGSLRWCVPKPVQNRILPTILRRNELSLAVMDYLSAEFSVFKDMK